MALARLGLLRQRDYLRYWSASTISLFGTQVTQIAIPVIAVVVLAAILGPKGPSEAPDPTVGGANPRPEWPFLWLFALLSMSPESAETFIILVFPVILIAILFLVPFISNRGERACPACGWP